MCSTHSLLRNSQISLCINHGVCALHLNALFHLNTNAIKPGLKTHKKLYGYIVLTICSHVPHLQHQCCIIGISLQKGPIGSSRHEEAHSLRLTTGLGVGVWKISWSKPLLTSKRGYEGWPHGCPCWALDRCLWKVVVMGYRPAQCNLLQRHISHTLPWWWPDLKAALHCFSAWLCACLP